MDGITAVILNHLELLGWAVSVHRVNGTVEMHAVLQRNPDTYHVARCNDGDGDGEAYRCACLLARAAGVEWARG